MIESLIALQIAASVYWADGDSGRIDGVPFRLADVDAPELSGAECPVERAMAYEAKAAAIRLTAGAELGYELISTDRYGRRVISLRANGRDVGETLVALGKVRPWPHDHSGGTERPLAPRPVWCEAS